jgi:tether containing UBX domain for GLUT4
VSDPAVRDLTLAQLSLAPSSILYLSFLDANLNNSSMRAPLAEDILRLAEDLPLPPSVDPTPSNSVRTDISKKEDKGKGSSGEKKIPKWLKLGSGSHSIYFATSCPVLMLKQKSKR